MFKLDNIAFHLLYNYFYMIGHVCGYGAGEGFIMFVGTVFALYLKHAPGAKKC